MFTATLCFYDLWLHIFDHVVCSVSEQCFGNCYLPHKGDLKGIRSCTKGWRPLLIGCNGSLHMRVVFLLRSFKILILNLCLAFVLQSAVDWLQYVLLSISQSLSMFVRSLVTSSWEENSFCPSGNSLSGSSCGLLPFCCCPVDLAFPVELDGLRRKSPIATFDSAENHEMRHNLGTLVHSWNAPIYKRKLRDLFSEAEVWSDLDRPMAATETKAGGSSSGGLSWARVCKECGQQHEGLESHLYEYQDDVDDELMCHICLQPLIRPMDTPCGHTYCFHCLSNFLKEQDFCPVDRQRLQLHQCRPSSLLVKNLLDKLVVICPHSSECQQKMQRCELQPHLHNR